MAVHHFLQIGDLNFLNKFYQQKLFFSNVPGETKEEVIHTIGKSGQDCNTAPLKAEKDEETQKFYEVTANFLSDKETVQTLIQNLSFETFEKLITALKR